MNTDKYGLPIQADGDAADQLQRVGMIAVGQVLAGYNIVTTDLDYAMRWLLQVQPGVYRRYYETATTNDVTADQLIPVIAYWSLLQNRAELQSMHWVFAQNTRKQGELNVKTIPDFMLIRALPLILRCYNLPNIIYLCIDSLLLLAVLCYTILNRGMDDVDDNNLVITLVVCRSFKPSLLSRLSGRLYRSLRAANFGSSAYNTEPAVGALKWYHRQEALGNPEIGELWGQLIKQYL